MQLHAIALYSHDGRRREIAFRPGRLNVISGRSATGKSAVLEIIDYCFGRSGSHLPAGPIRDRVSWFAMLLGDDEQPRIMIGRPVPTGQTSGQAMLRTEVGVRLPEPGELKVNADRGALRAALDRELSLGEFEQADYSGGRTRLRASVSHAILFCLQKPQELMSDRHLFHRQDDPDVARDFAALFPYFLGAVDEQTLALQRELSEAKRLLRLAAARRERAESSRGDVERRDVALVNEARALGLVPPNTETDVPEPRELLRTIGTEEDPTPSRLTEPEFAPERPLRRQLEEAQSELRILVEQRAALDELNADRGGHIRALAIQSGRLRITEGIEGHPDHEPEPHCVLCGNVLGDADERAVELLALARHLDEQISELNVAAKDMSTASRILEEEIEAAKVEVSELSAELEARLDADDASRAHARVSERQAYFRGIVAEHVRSADRLGPPLQAVAVAVNAERELEQRVAVLSEKAEPETIRRETEDRLDNSAARMTEWARRLGLEWADEGLVRIDRRELTVAVVRPHDRVLLSQMGSTANHVGYHIVSHLALHEYFLRVHRPVPRFVFFDQPSLPFFPSEEATDAAAADVDWNAVKALFELSRDAVELLGGGFQVIVADHAAYRNDPWFTDALVADWHHGEKLVPQDWPSKQD